MTPAFSLIKLPLSNYKKCSRSFETLNFTFWFEQQTVIFVLKQSLLAYSQNAVIILKDKLEKVSSVTMFYPPS